MLARLTVWTSVVVARGAAPLLRCAADRTSGSAGATRNPCFSARCWKPLSREHAGPARAGVLGHLAGGRRELVVLGVERARGRAQADDPPQRAALAEHG